MAAAHLGHADTMGRAYPEAQMTSVAVGDLRSYPCVLYDPRGIEVVVRKVPSWKSMERVSDFVPLAGAWRQVADHDVEAELVGQLLQFAFPQPAAARATGLWVQSSARPCWLLCGSAMPILVRPWQPRSCANCMA